MERQRARFITKFGREPGPGDPIFFDPNADEPRPFDAHALEDSLIDAARKAGVDPVRMMQSLNMRDCEIERALQRAVRRSRG